MLLLFLGPEKSRALPIFHAFTGCDTIESFHGLGKPSVFAAWSAFPEVTQAFLAMGTEDYDEDNEKQIEQFVIVMYDR